MAELPPVLDNKIGPYSVGVWALLIGGGAGLGLILRRRYNASSSSGDGTLPAISDETGAAVVPRASSGGANYVQSGVNAASSQAATPANNSEWANAAIRYLVGKGVNAAQAQAAVTRFVNGYGVTNVEAGYVADAIAAQGPPPEQVDPITIAPTEPPAGTPGPTFTAPTVVTPRSVSLGSLVSPDGDTVFHTDGRSIEWVQNGNVSRALWKSGARVKSVVGDGPDAFPEPLQMSVAEIRSLPLVGPPPPGWPAW